MKLAIATFDDTHKTSSILLYRRPLGEDTPAEDAGMTHTTQLTHVHRHMDRRTHTHAQANLLKGYVPWSVGDTPSCPLHHKHMSHKCQTLHSLVHCPLQLERLPSPNPLVSTVSALQSSILPLRASALNLS